VRFKKPWSDGLNHDFDHLDEFEAKFYCFGGDGGGGGGGGSSNSSSNTQEQNARAAAQEPVRGRASAAPATGFRGEQSAAAAQARSNFNSRAAAADQVRDQAVFDSGYYDTPTTQNAPGIAEMYPSAMVPDFASYDKVIDVNPTTVSYEMPTEELPTVNYGSINDMFNAPQEFVPSYQAPPVLDSVVDKARSFNQFDIGPGTLSVTPEFDMQRGLTGGKLEYSVPLGGISSVQSNPMVDAIMQGMNRAQTAPAAPTTDLAFTDTITNVYGTLTDPETYVGNNLVRRGNVYTSASQGGISSTRREPSMYDKITSTGKTMADQVGLGSLFN